MADEKKDAEVVTSGSEPGVDAPTPLGEYADAKGNTWQLDEADAKRLGYARVENKAIQAGQVENKRPSRAASKGV